MARESKGITLPIIYKANLDGLKQAEGALAGFGKKLAGVAAGIAAAFSVRAIANFAKESVLAAEAAQTAQNRLEAVAKATGVFGAETQKVTDRLGEFAKAQELRIGVDDKVIKGVQAQLLSFKQLSTTADEAGGTFDRVTKAAFDMAAAGFGSAESNAIALGKAFEDPVKGLTALRRNGTTFTEEQQELIKSLVATGDVAGAQSIILGELESQYGGVAEATADASVKMGLALDNIKETAGAALLPVFADLVEGMMPVLEIVGEELAAAFESLGPVLTEIVAQLPSLLKAFTPLIPVLGTIAGVFLELIAKLLPPFITLFEKLLPIIEELAPVLAEVFLEVLNALIPVFMEIVTAMMPIVSALLPVLAKLIQALAPIVVKLIQAFLPLIQLILPIIIQLLGAVIPIAVRVAEILSVVVVAAVNWLVRSFQGFMTFLTTFATSFREAFNQIRLFFGNIINGMISMFEGFVNAVINGVNSMIRALNRLSFSVPTWVPGPLSGKRLGFSIPEIGRVTFPRVALAEGGIVTRPVSALVGEAGPEAVIPLDRFDSMGGNTYNITVNAGMGSDGARLGEEIVRAIKKYERVSGPVFASV
jgi:phage-related protein